MFPRWFHNHRKKNSTDCSTFVQNHCATAATAAGGCRGRRQWGNTEVCVAATACLAAGAALWSRDDEKERQCRSWVSSSFTTSSFATTCCRCELPPVPAHKICGTLSGEATPAIHDIAKTATADAKLDTSIATTFVAALNATPTNGTTMPDVAPAAASSRSSGEVAPARDNTSNITTKVKMEEEDSFPNLTRHAKSSPLRQFLTRAVYDELRDRRTRNGVTLEDVIRAGVSLPYGSDPPHGIAGVYAGDAESYTTFGALLNPIIEAHHKATSRVRLQRFRSNLNPGGLLQRQLDPDGQYILYTRMRLARSIQGFRFPPCMERIERRAVERIFRECVLDWNESSGSDHDSSGKSSSGGGAYISVMDMTNKQHDELVRRRFLFPDPDDYIVSAGLARDWPDGRGVYCDTWEDGTTPNLMIWCNAMDHLWIISNAKGGDVQGVFKRMSKAVWALETSLKQRGHGFVEDPRLGFVNACPADIGTALRASVYIKLVRLGQHAGFDNLMQRLRLEARAEEYSRRQYSSSSNTSRKKLYTGIFDIGNAEALGKTEVQLINIMIHGVAVCIDLERRLENGETLDLDSIDIGSVP